MGIETVFPIGTVLTRKEKKGDAEDSLRVVGAGDKLVVTPHEEFGGNFELKIRVAREEYEADIPEGSQILRVPPVAKHEKSPEQIFAEAAKQPGATTKRARTGSKTAKVEVENGKDK